MAAIRANRCRRGPLGYHLRNRRCKGSDRQAVVTGNATGRVDGGTVPGLDGQFSGIAVDARGNVYVTESAAFNRVVKLSSGGTVLASWGGTGKALRQLNRPRGITVDSRGNVYVADGDNQRIVSYTADGTPLRSWRIAGADGEGFHIPIDVAVDARGRLYVSLDNGFGVFELSPPGKLLAHWDSFGMAPHQIGSPGGIVVDRKGNVFLADTGNGRIAELNAAR